MKRKNISLGSCALVLILAIFVACPGASEQVPRSASAWGPMREIETAARREGKVHIYYAGGHINREAIEAINRVMTEKFAIAPEWTLLTPNDMMQRVLTEARTKQNVADIGMYGYPNVYTTLRAKDQTASILAPSTLEPGVWRFEPSNVDPDVRGWLHISMTYRPGLLINTQLVPSAEEPKSYRDLLHPRWKGRIVIQTPEIPGATTGWFSSTYSYLGLDFMRALAPQVEFVRSTNDLADSVARGQYAIAIASPLARSLAVIQEGAPVKYLNAKEGGHTGSNGLMLYRNAPHPDAAKTFLNWFYTKEGQSAYCRNFLCISVRKDVAQDYLPPEVRYIEGTPFMRSKAEDLEDKRARELGDLAIEIFVKRKK